MVKNKIDELMSIGINIGKKDVLHRGVRPGGQRVIRHQIERLALLATFSNLLRCLVGMETCLSADLVSWTLRKLDVELGIGPANYLKPFI